MPRPYQRVYHAMFAVSSRASPLEAWICCTCEERVCSARIPRFVPYPFARVSGDLCRILSRLALGIMDLLHV